MTTFKSIKPHLYTMSSIMLEVALQEQVACVKVSWEDEKMGSQLSKLPSSGWFSHYVLPVHKHSRDPKRIQGSSENWGISGGAAGSTDTTEGPRRNLESWSEKTMTAWAKRIRPGNFVVQLPYILHMHYVYISFITYIYILYIDWNYPPPSNISK